MLFIGLTIYKVKYKDGSSKDVEPNIRLRYSIKDIEFYQEHNNGTSLVTKDNTRFYCKETVEQIDMLLNGADGKIVGLLYGKE